jgi:F420-non-reducing hydrogenase iron-sulfur subunit
VDPQFVLEAFQAGADGVMILGCHPGDCHYREGNVQALKRYAMMKPLLAAFGIEEERLRLDWISASEQDKFVKVVSDMTRRIRELGPVFRKAGGR